MFSTIRAVRPTNINLRNKKSFALYSCCVSTTNRSVKNIPARLPIDKVWTRSRCNVPVINNKFLVLNREFHTTERRDIPPILALLLRPALRVGSFFFGRTLRKWWAKKSAAEREQYASWFRGKKLYFYGILGGSLTALLAYYLTHFENTPITNRSRFIMFSEQQQEAFGKLMYEMYLAEYKKNIISPNNPIYQQLQAMTNHLINANQDVEMLRDKKWTLNVIDDPSRNAFVLPGGNIFVFTGLLRMVENSDQLLFVVAHEIAHVLMKHHMERISNGFIIDVLLVVPVIALSALFPDLVASLLQLIGHVFLKIVNDLPFHRENENEADEVGLMLAAKACVDVREAVVFWGLLRAGDELNPSDEEIPWLSTHPNHKDREKNLDKKMSEALALRNNNLCPVLRSVDPRKKFYEQSPKELEARLKNCGILTQ